jgi:hypothetical protein
LQIRHFKVFPLIDRLQKCCFGLQVTWHSAAQRLPFPVTQATKKPDLVIFPGTQTPQRF